MNWHVFKGETTGCEMNWIYCVAVPGSCCNLNEVQVQIAQGQESLGRIKNSSPLISEYEHHHHHLADVIFNLCITNPPPPKHFAAVYFFTHPFISPPSYNLIFFGRNLCFLIIVIFVTVLWILQSGVFVLQACCTFFAASKNTNKLHL